MEPVHALEFVRANSSHGGADVVAGRQRAREETFRLPGSARAQTPWSPSVALYNGSQILPAARKCTAKPDI